MKLARLFGLTLVAIAAMSLGVVATASASPPLFSPASGQAINGTSGTSILFAGGHLIVCGKDVFSGAISSSSLLGNAHVHYLSCVSLATPTSAEHCTANSSGASGGLILTQTLHGRLGIILPSGATGILFLPQSGKVFVELAENACTPETKVTGNVAGAITPTGKPQTTGTTTFSLSAGVAAVKDFDLTNGGGLVKPELVAFSEAGALSQTEETETAANLEVT